MASKTISYTTAGNHWRWVGNYYQEVQVGQLITFPEKGKITALKFKVAGLGPYYDPVYHSQQDHTKVAAAVWASNGAILTHSAVTDLGPEDGGAQTWKTFNVPDLWVNAGQKIIVGFWRIKTTTEYATQWDYNDSATGEIYVQQDIGGTSASGPVNFAISDSQANKSINYEIDYLAGGHVKVYNGPNDWYDATARVWTGSAWAEATVKVWNGSSWVESV